MVVMISADARAPPWGRTRYVEGLPAPRLKTLCNNRAHAWAAWDAWAYEPEQPWSTHRFTQTSAAAGGAESTLQNVLQNDFTDLC